MTRHGNQFEAARKKYEAHVRNKSKAVGMTPVEYVATKTTLFEGGVDNASPSILALRKETISQEPKREKEDNPTGLPACDAEIDIVVREPRGEFRFHIVVPNIGADFGVERRHQRGYLELFNRGLAYAIYGELR